MNVDPFIIFAYIVGVFTIAFDIRNYNRSSERSIEQKIHPIYMLMGWAIVFMPKNIEIGWIWKQLYKLGSKKIKAFLFYY